MYLLLNVMFVYMEVLLLTLFLDHSDYDVHVHACVCSKLCTYQSNIIIAINETTYWTVFSPTICELWLQKGMAARDFIHTCFKSKRYDEKERGQIIPSTVNKINILQVLWATPTCNKQLGCPHDRAKFFKRRKWFVVTRIWVGFAPAQRSPCAYGLESACIVSVVFFFCSTTFTYTQHPYR